MTKMSNSGLLVLLSGCGVFFGSPPMETMCESHCWNIVDCARENDPHRKVDRTLPVEECADDCMQRWTHAQVKDAYVNNRRHLDDPELNRGINGCEYLEYFARRYGENAECVDGVVSVAVDGKIYDCYVR